MVKNVNAECHPVTNIDGIILRWLDRGQKILGSKRDWFWLRKYGFSFDTVADQERYTLSPLVDTAKIITFYDSDNSQYIYNMTETDFRRVEPGPTLGGEPWIYRLVEFSPVATNPSSASVLSLVSSSASDAAPSGTVVVTLQGLSDGVMKTEDVTITGTTPVSSTYEYTKMFTISKNVKSVGEITITSNAAAVTNVVIAPGDRYVSHPVVLLFGIPSSVETMYYDFTMKIQTLSSDNDVSVIPEQYHDAIELYATAKTFKHLNNPTMAQLTMAEFQSRVQDMIGDDKQPKSIWSQDKFQASVDPRIARLPSNYPRTRD